MDTVILIIFALVAALVIGAATMVVTVRNVIHAALWLIASFFGVGALYLLLEAEFIAVVQVLVYVGAIVVLMLFGLMLTRADIGKSNFDNDQRLLAAICAAAMFGVMSYVLVDAFEGQEIDLTKTEGTTAGSVGDAIFSAYVLPFEVVSVLLLAALVGAVVIARRDTEEDD